MTAPAPAPKPPGSPLRRRLMRLTAAGAGAILLASAAVRSMDNDDTPVPPMGNGVTASAKVDPQRMASVHLEAVASAAHPDWMLVRHGQAATTLANKAAAQLFDGREVSTGYMQGNPFDARTEAEAFALSRVITVSMVAQMPYEMGEACDRFEKLPGIVVQAAGNEGGENAAAHQAQWSTPMQCADLIVRVGAAHNGHIEDYSSRSTPDIVGENPWRLGFAYPLYRDEAALDREIALRRPEMQAEYIEELRQQAIMMLVLDTDTTTLAKRLDMAEGLNARKGPIWDGFKAAAEKDFADALVQVRAKLLEMAQKAEANQRAADWPGLRNLMDAMGGDPPTSRDAGGFVHDSDGTSWSTPSLGGSLGAGLLAFPKLSDEDAVVAALLTARKIVATETAAGPLAYRHNGRGLSFNDSQAGFGLFDPDAYARQMAAMEHTRRAHPQAATHRVPVAMRQSRGNLATGVSFDVTEDAVALRGMVILAVPEGKAPAVLTLIAPDGTRLQVAPAKLSAVMPDGSKADQLSIATSGMLGSGTRGRWTVLAEGSTAPAVAQLRVVAVQKNSVADRAIAAAVQTGPQPLHQMARDIVKKSTIRWTRDKQPALVD